MPYQPSEILAQMRASFAGQLPLRLEAIRLAVADMQKRPWDIHRVVHLQRLLHNLAGASGTFGLAMVGLSARCMDDAVAALAKCTDYPGEAQIVAVFNGDGNKNLSYLFERSIKFRDN